MPPKHIMNIYNRPVCQNQGAYSLACLLLVSPNTFMSIKNTSETDKYNHIFFVLLKKSVVNVNCEMLSADVNQKAVPPNVYIKKLLILALL